MLDAEDPHKDLESMDHTALLEVRAGIWAKAKNSLADLNDHDMGRLSRCIAILRRTNSGPPKEPRKQSAKKVAAALPSDLSDIPV